MDITYFETSHYRTEFEKASRIFLWCKRLLSLVGLWPSKNRDVLFWTLFIYFSFYKLLDGITLFIAAGKSLQHFITSLAYNVTYIHIFLRFLILKVYNNYYGALFDEVINDYNEEVYKLPEEKNSFLEYNRKCKTFMKVLAPISVTSSTVQYLRPFLITLHIYGKRSANSTTPLTLILPNGFYYPYKIVDMQTYALTFASQCPFVVLSSVINVGMDYVLLSLVYHLCGRFSALSYRIRDLNSEDHSQDFEKVLQDYIHLLRISKDVQKAFSVCLFVHFMLSATLSGIVLHELLVFFKAGQTHALVAYFITGSLNTIRLYSYCKVGDYLIMESTNVSDAFYSCHWYNMSSNNQKRIVFCISRGQSPSCLLAGRFGSYSLSKFTDIMKTSLAYFSFLRNFI